MAIKDPRKQSLYLTDELSAEIRHHAKRLDRRMSWVVQQAYWHGRGYVERLPDAMVRGKPDEVVEGEVN